MNITLSKIFDSLIYLFAIYGALCLLDKLDKLLGI